MREDDEHRYDDIINLPHHRSATHPHMSMHDRAAQFAPFAALTGHEEAIKETARLTDESILLDENEISLLDTKLRWVQEKIARNPEISVTYFEPDKRKSGGSYQSFVGNVKKIDNYERCVVFTNGTRIFIDRIVEIDISSNFH